MRIPPAKKSLYDVLRMMLHKGSDIADGSSEQAKTRFAGGPGNMGCDKGVRLM